MKLAFNKFAMSTITGAAMLAAASTPALADPVGGRENHDTYVYAGDSDYYDIELFGNEETLIELSGDCHNRYQDIDLWVYDRAGREVGKSTGYGCEEVVSIWPDRNGVFKVRVENVDKPYDTDYHLTIW